jgi:FAD/FMN-containing dehydrogenase
MLSAIGRRAARAVAFRPSTTRAASSSVVSELDLQHFASIVGPANLVTDSAELEAYNVDWMRSYRGSSRLAIRPGSTDEVSRILAHCNEHRLTVVPQGGNTGLVGGSVPLTDEIVLSLSRMNRVLSLDEHAGHLVCEAGCVLESLQDHAVARGYTMPLDLGAKGSCQIGGNLATNAGGLRLLRYGSLHGSVLGLEAVLADGTVLDDLAALRKDNTGYDIKQLFIGSEGTLGVITGVSLALPRAPSSIQLAFLGLDSYDEVLATFSAARRDLGEVLSAIEFLDAESYQLVAATNPVGARKPLEREYRHYILLELSGSNAAHDEEKLSTFLENVLSAGHVADGTIAQDRAQAAAIWRVREGITAALSQAGAVYKYDVSLPLAQLYELVEVMRARLEGEALVTGFGHLGDGNLHLNICTPGDFEKTPEMIRAIEPYVYEWIAEQRGSISAEHGLGSMKPQFLHLAKPEPLIELMRGIKEQFDPNGILNPGKVLPPRVRSAAATE